MLTYLHQFHPRSLRRNRLYVRTVVCHAGPGQVFSFCRHILFSTPFSFIDRSTQCSPFSYIATARSVFTKPPCSFPIHQRILSQCFPPSQLNYRRNQTVPQLFIAQSGPQRRLDAITVEGRGGAIGEAQMSSQAKTRWLSWDVGREAQRMSLNASSPSWKRWLFERSIYRYLYSSSWKLY